MNVYTLKKLTHAKLMSPLIRGVMIVTNGGEKNDNNHKKILMTDKLLKYAFHTQVTDIHFG